MQFMTIASFERYRYFTDFKKYSTLQLKCIPKYITDNEFYCYYNFILFWTDGFLLQILAAVSVRIIVSVHFVCNLSLYWRYSMGLLRHPCNFIEYWYKTETLLWPVSHHLHFIHVLGINPGISSGCFCGVSDVGTWYSSLLFEAFQFISGLVYGHVWPRRRLQGSHFSCAAQCFAPFDCIFRCHFGN